MSTAAANKATIQQYIETWNTGNLEDLSEFWSPRLVHHTRSSDHGYEDVRRIVGAIMTAFPDMHFRVEDIIAEGDKVVTHMTWRGTQTGSYMGAPPSGKRIECALIGIARVVDGKIVEHWGVTDELAMMQQMGLVPDELLLAMA